MTTEKKFKIYAVVLCAAHMVLSAAAFFWIHGYLVFWDRQNFVESRRKTLEFAAASGARGLEYGNPAPLIHALKNLAVDDASRYGI